ncbi:hypothetical protein ACFZB6_13380 [Streptomyces syringium]|uniref:hypothetical protein n=1 Tax=Streptomyces syringium TaxID=76729 RepID=UPI0033A3B1A6
MATANLIGDPRPPAMASPGYGKRPAPDQAPRRRDDFAHLPEREACIASHIDRLPDGAAIDTKTLAATLPAYGQQAVRSGLNALSHAGHLRRVREQVGEGRTQWVFRTYFSRTPRGDAWWACFLAGDVPNDAPDDVVDSPVAAAPRLPTEVHPDERPRPARPVPTARPLRSDAYEALATLGGTDARLTLSAAECAALEGLAAQWLARGVTPSDFARILTAGLPDVVHSPGALTRKRLIDKLPPEPVRSPQAAAPAAPRRLMECTGCRTPGRPEALPGGLCRPCRGDLSDEPLGPTEAEIHSRVERLRAAVRAAR